MNFGQLILNNPQNQISTGIVGHYLGFVFKINVKWFREIVATVVTIQNDFHASIVAESINCTVIVISYIATTFFGMIIVHGPIP